MPPTSCARRSSTRGRCAACTSGCPKGLQRCSAGSRARRSSMRTTSTHCARRYAAPMLSKTRFLLVRLDGLGDALACVPGLAGLSRAFPEAQFGAVCSKANSRLFSTRVRTHLYAAGALDELGDELASAGYTHAIVATEEVAGYRLARLSGAKKRTGFWHRFEKTFKSLWQYSQLTDPVYRPAAWTARPEHEVEALYRLSGIFGEAPLGIQVTPKLASVGWGPGALGHFIVAALEASTLRRCLLLAPAADEGFARSILEQLPRALRERDQVALAPPADLPHWLGAIESLAALITPDTGAAHAAGMLGVPVIDLFDEARFAQLSRQWRPWAAPHRCVIK